MHQHVRHCWKGKTAPHLLRYVQNTCDVTVFLRGNLFFAYPKNSFYLFQSLEQNHACWKKMVLYKKCQPFFFGSQKLQILKRWGCIYHFLSLKGLLFQLKTHAASENCTTGWLWHFTTSYQISNENIRENVMTF